MVAMQNVPPAYPILYQPECRERVKQAEIDGILDHQDVETPPGREESPLAISLFCDFATGTHPVEAFQRVNRRILYSWLLRKWY